METAGASTWPRPMMCLDTIEPFASPAVSERCHDWPERRHDVSATDHAGGNARNQPHQGRVGMSQRTADPSTPPHSVPSKYTLKSTHAWNFRKAAIMWEAGLWPTPFGPVDQNVRSTLRPMAASMQVTAFARARHTRALAPTNLNASDSQTIAAPLSGEGTDCRLVWHRRHVSPKGQGVDGVSCRQEAEGLADTRQQRGAGGGFSFFQYVDMRKDSTRAASACRRGSASGMSRKR